MRKFLLSAQLQHQRLRVFPDLKLARRIAVASGSALEYCGFGNECAKPWHLPLVWPVQRRVVDLVQLLRHRALLSRRLRQGARPAEPMLQRGSWPKQKKMAVVCRFFVGSSRQLCSRQCNMAVSR